MEGLFFYQLCLLEGGNELSEVVAVNLGSVPAKGLPFFSERLQLHNVIGPAVYLQLISVDDGDKVVELEVGGSHGGFPDLTFITFTVSH